MARARKIQRFLSQPMHVAEVFTNLPGKFVPLEDNIRSFDAICKGEYDHLPEAAFYLRRAPSRKPSRRPRELADGGGLTAPSRSGRPGTGGHAPAGPFFLRDRTACPRNGPAAGGGR